MSDSQSSKTQLSDLDRLEQWASVVATELLNSDALCGQGLHDQQLSKVADALVEAVVKHWDSPLLIRNAEIERLRAERQELMAFRSATLTALAYLEGSPPLVESAIELLREVEEKYVEAGEAAPADETTAEQRS
jgi:hypothetical protein